MVVRDVFLFFGWRSRGLVIGVICFGGINRVEMRILIFDF